MAKFQSKYPELFSSIVAPLQNYYKTFEGQETYAGVQVSHKITNAGEIDNFCSHLIDSNQEEPLSNAQVKNLRSWTSIAPAPEKVTEIKREASPEVSRETSKPKQVKVKDTTPPQTTSETVKSSTETSTPNTTGPSIGDVRKSGRGFRQRYEEYFQSGWKKISRARYNSQIRNTRGQSNNSNNRRRGGLARRTQESQRGEAANSGNPPSGRGRFPFETRREGGNSWVWKRNRWSRI